MLASWIAFASGLEENLANTLAGISRKCVRYPRLTILLYFSACFALMTGLLQLEAETEAEKLWVDLNSETHKNMEIVDDQFPSASRFNRLLVGLDANNDDSIFGIDTLNTLFDIHERVVALSVPIKDDDGMVVGNYTLADLCARRFDGECDSTGILKFWDFNREFFDAGFDTEVKIAELVAQSRYPTGELVNTADYAGFSVTRDTGGKPISASGKAGFLTWNLEGTFRAAGVELETEIQTQWEEAFAALAAKFDDEYEGLRLTYETRDSIDNELEEAVGSDTFLIMISYVLMVAFASQTLGKPFSAVNGRVMLASADVFVILFAVGGAYGLAIYLGVVFSSIAQVLPLILLGIGIDDAYIISGSFDRETRISPDSSVESRMFTAIHRAGMSITVTSLTDFCAFILGSITRLPAIMYFCQDAAISVLFIYIAHLTVFPALLALDDARQRAHRLDVAPCVVHKKTARLAAKQQQQQQQQSDVAADEEDPETTNEHVSSKSMAAGTKDDLTEQEIARMSPVGQKLATAYGSLLMNNSCRVIVIVLYVAFSVFSAYQATLIGTEFLLSDLTRDGSDLNGHYKHISEYWGEGGIPGGLPTQLYFGDIEYSDVDVQIEIERLTDSFEKGEWIGTETGVFSVHRSLRQWAVAQRATGADFPRLVNVTDDNTSEQVILVAAKDYIDAMRKFLDSPFGLAFKDNVVWTDSQTRLSIQNSRVLAFHVSMDNSYENVDALEEGEALVASSTLDPKPFVSSPPYVFFDQYRIIVPEMIQNLGLTLIAVMVICAFILVHPLSVIILLFVLGTIFVDLLGSINIWSLDLNSISAVNLVMAIGLVVDYSSHIIHFFGLQDPLLSRKQRVKLTLGEIGPSVMLGCFTTFLGVLPLAFASSEVFRTFFKMFVSIVLIGGTHGLVVLPVILSFIGPSIVRGPPKVEEGKE